VGALVLADRVRGRRFAAATLLIVLLMPGCGGAVAPRAFSTRPAAFPAPLRPPAAVFLIMMENHSWSSIEGNRSAPYINRLLRDGALGDRYFTPPGNHPSLPNYLWLEAGTNFGIADDAAPAAHRLRTGAHLTTLLSRAGISWMAYEEGIDGKSCPISDAGSYATRHNPMVYFTDVTGNLNPRSRYCIAHERPFTELARDLRSKRVARYNFITPNVCDDMHDACAPVGDAIRQGDLWLSHAVPALEASQAYRAGGVIFIAWDEGDGDSDGPLGLIALSPLAKRGYVSHTTFTHSSLLRTLEEILGVRRLLGGARSSNDLRNLFKRLP